MTQRTNSGGTFSDQPFGTEGTSLYVTAGETVQYRNFRVIHCNKRKRNRGGWIKGTTGVHDIANAVTKTARRAFTETEAFSYSLPAELIPGSGTQGLAIDVRTCADHVENEHTAYREVVTTIDDSGDEVTEIRGTAQLLSKNARDAGVVRLRFSYFPSTTGVQPTQFRIEFTAGPTSPADIVQAYSGESITEIDTAALSDASAYTITISAENGATALDLLTGVSITADATGPVAAATATATAI